MKKMMLVVVFVAFAAGELAAASTVDLEFLKDLIRIPSVSADVAEVNRAAEFTRRSAELKGLFCHPPIERNPLCFFGFRFCGIIHAFKRDGERKTRTWRQR